MYGPAAATLATLERSLERFEPGKVMKRLSVATTAAAFSGVPSLNEIPCLSGTV